MTVRYRDNVLNSFGVLERFNRQGVITSSQQRLFRSLDESMTDTVGYRFIDNPARSTSTRYKPAKRNGEIAATAFVNGTRYIDYPIFPDLAHLVVTLNGDPGFMGAAVSGAAMANPSLGKGQVSLPMSLVELRELPRLMLNKHTWGDFDAFWDRINFRRRTDPSEWKNYPKSEENVDSLYSFFSGGKPPSRSQTNSVIEYQFGWVPMIADIVKLMQFPSTVERRITELNALRSDSDRKVSRTRTPWSASGSNEQRILETTGTFWKVNTQKTKDYRVTTRWRPRDELQNLGDPEMAEFARKLSLSITPQSLVRQAWDVVPWTWLIDWFSTFGDFMSLTDNSVAFRGSPVLVTEKETTVTTVTFDGSTTGLKDLDNAPGRKVTVYWQRYLVPTLVPTFYIPLLNTGQTMILASLLYNKGTQGFNL